MTLITINSKSLHYTLYPASASSPSSLTLIFLHGLGSTSSFYAPIIPLLSSAGHACLTVDTHGSGLSAYTGAGNSITSIAADVLGLLDALAITANVVLVGHSMGGIVASHLAATAPALIRAAVLIGPVNPNPGAAEVFSKRIIVVERGQQPSPRTALLCVY